MPQVQRDLAHDLREKREQLKQVREATIPIPMSGAARKTTSNGWQRKIEALEEKGVTPEVEQRLGGLGAQEIPELAKNTGEDDKPYQLADARPQGGHRHPGHQRPRPGSPPPVRPSASRGRPRAPPLKARYKHIYVHSAAAGGRPLYPAQLGQYQCPQHA